MTAASLGTLDPADPLYAYLCRFLPQPVDKPVFESYSLHPDQLMIRYDELSSGHRLACKFYARKLPLHREPTEEYFRARLQEEVARMEEMRRLGFDRPPYRVPRVLGTHEDLEFLMVQEFVPGDHLDDFIARAYSEGERGPLTRRLQELGHFLGRLHRVSYRRTAADPEPGLGFLRDMLDDLRAKGRFSGTIDVDAWREALAEAPEVLQHGDCTPMNFVFPAAGEVVALDLERSARGDGMRDIGSVQAELVVAAQRLAGDVALAHPDLETLRQAYGLEWPEDEDDNQLARRRYWTGAFLLRIARNDWIQKEDVPPLLEEAKKCLKPSKPFCSTSTVS